MAAQAITINVSDSRYSTGTTTFYTVPAGKVAKLEIRFLQVEGGDCEIRIGDIAYYDINSSIETTIVSLGQERIFYMEAGDSFQHISQTSFETHYWTINALITLEDE